MSDVEKLLPAILHLHDRIRTSVIDAFERQQATELSSVAHDDSGEGDTIYAIDRVSEQTLIEVLGEFAKDDPVILVAEGLPNEGITLPAGTKESDCRWRILVDPIDGTRGLMYQKRPAWILTGVAPNKGKDTTLRDIELAVHTEIPLIKQHLCDQLWAIRGLGVNSRRFNRLTGEHTPLALRPSREEGVAHGFASVSRFFPGARDVLASLDDEIMIGLEGPPAAGKAVCFEDQYISTGGQLYELMAGHDRFIADVRPLLASVFAEREMPQPLCCHPYDLCTILVAEELGVIITDENGWPLDARLDLESDVSWVGYANEQLRARIQPILRAALAKRNLLAP